MTYMYDTLNNKEGFLKGTRLGSVGLVFQKFVSVFNKMHMVRKML